MGRHRHSLLIFVCLAITLKCVTGDDTTTEKLNNTTVTTASPTENGNSTSSTDDPKTLTTLTPYDTNVNQSTPSPKPTTPQKTPDNSSTSSTGTPAPVTTQMSTTQKPTNASGATSTSTVLPSTASTLTPFSTTSTTTILPTSNPLTSTTTAAQSSTATSTTTPKPTPSSTVTVPDTSTTPRPSVTTNATPSINVSEVRISESNILLVNSSDVSNQFVELQGNAGENVTGLWFVILDANSTHPPNSLVMKELTFTFSEMGKYVIKDNMEEIHDVEAVLIALYSIEPDVHKLTIDSMVDALFYSTQGRVSGDFEEIFKNVAPEKLIINQESWKNLGNVSLSRCSEEVYNEAFILSASSEGDENSCTLTKDRTLHMKLTKNKQTCKSEYWSDNFVKSFKRKIVNEVNSIKQCGLAWLMMNDSDINHTDSCVDPTLEIILEFKVKAFYDQQLDLVVQGYQSFVEEQHTVTFDKGQIFDLANCSLKCSKSDAIIPPQPSSDDDKVKVTVAVVVSCIGVFLLVVLFVIIYMKRKRRGILQFRMTRLDEDDNDLIGDMDDFVGNQGPTFRNYR